MGGCAEAERWVAEVQRWVAEAERWVAENLLTVHSRVDKVVRCLEGDQW
jgi:hypothetical protein